jgi:two-component system sensor histidine kinase KdpD
VDVADAVRGAVARAKKNFPTRRIETFIPAKLPLIRGDAALLEQVMFNLLDNAHKYSPPGPVTRVRITLAASGAIQVVVADEGIGIPSEASNKIFDKFYRAHVGDGRQPGTGLGLSICAGIIAAMGGTITAQSPKADGKGTEISIVLPAAEGRATEQNAPKDVA